jgi:hypothetical protein
MSEGKTYEEANWAKLSPAFRNAHNRLRQTRGLSPIPPPKIDLYVAPRGPEVKPFDPSNPDFVAATRQFLGSTLPAPGNEGFTINGRTAR